MSQIKEISVNFSKKIGNANFGSDMVSASITMSVESDSEVSAAYKEAWAIVHEEVEKQENLLDQDKAIAESVKQSTNFVQDINADPVQKCPVHGLEFVLRPAGISKTTGKGYPAFWACPGKNPDGSYCREKRTEK